MNYNNTLIKILTALCLLVAKPSYVWAQADDYVPTPCQSKWTEYGPQGENTSIVRSNHNDEVVHLQYHEPLTGMTSHTFVIEKFSTGLTVPITTYFNVYDSTVYSVDITDMRLYDEECYFCGTVTWTAVDIFGNHTTHGIVGHFSPQAMLAGSGNVVYYIISETSHLTRLAITTHNNGLTLISAIGYTDQGSIPCMVELQQVLGITEWYVRMDKIKMPVGYIDFADIMYTGDSLSLLSQMPCVNDYPPLHEYYDIRHQWFLLDRFGPDGCYHDRSGMGPYFMAHHRLEDDSYCKFHHDRDPMRLFRIYDEERLFGVAYGVDETYDPMGGIRLFPFRHIWKYDSCMYYSTGRLAKVLDIGNIYNTGQLLLVSWHFGRIRNLVTLPALGSATHNVRWLSEPGGVSNYTFNSIGERSDIGYSFDITGHNSSSVYTRFNQALDFSLPSCFTSSIHHYEVFEEKRAAELIVEWKFDPLEDAKWVVAETQMNKMEEDVVCKKCGEREN